MTRAAWRRRSETDCVRGDTEIAELQNGRIAEREGTLRSCNSAEWRNACSGQRHRGHARVDGEGLLEAKHHSSALETRLEIHFRVGAAREPPPPPHPSRRRPD